MNLSCIKFSSFLSFFTIIYLVKCCSGFEKVTELDIRMTTPSGLISPPYIRFISTPVSDFFLLIEQIVILPKLKPLVGLIPAELIASYFRSFVALFSYTRFFAPFFKEFLYYLLEFILYDDNTRASVFDAVAIGFDVVQYFLHYGNSGGEDPFGRGLIVLFLYMIVDRIRNFGGDLHAPFRRRANFSFPFYSFVLPTISLLFTKRTIIYGCALIAYHYRPEISALLVSWNSYAYINDYEYEVMDIVNAVFQISQDRKVKFAAYILQQFTSFGLFYSYALSEDLLQKTPHSARVLPFISFLVPFYLFLFFRLINIEGIAIHSRPYFILALPFYALEHMLNGSTAKYQLVLLAFEKAQKEPERKAVASSAKRPLSESSEGTTETGKLLETANASEEGVKRGSRLLSDSFGHCFLGTFSILLLFL